MLYNIIAVFIMQMCRRALPHECGFSFRIRVSSLYVVRFVRVKCRISSFVSIFFALWENVFCICMCMNFVCGLFQILFIN